MLLIKFSNRKLISNSKTTKIKQSILKITIQQIPLNILNQVRALQALK